MSDWLEGAPEGLVVEVDHQVHVELGPARPRTWTPLSALGLGVVAAGTGAGVWLGVPELALSGFLFGVVALAAVRMWEFARYAAALRVSWDERGLLLERHYRDRILWRRALGWADVSGVAAHDRSLEIALRGVRPLLLSTPFRDPEQVQWVARELRQALQSHRAFEDEIAAAPDRARLEALVGRVEEP